MYKKIDKEKLDKMKQPELKAIAEKLEMKQLYKYKKDELRQQIFNKVREFEKFEERELGKYKRIEKMGNPGKDATTYLVSDNKTNIRIIEWPDLIKKKLSNKLEIYLDYTENQTERKVRFIGSGKWKNFK